MLRRIHHTCELSTQRVQCGAKQGAYMIANTRPSRSAASRTRSPHLVANAPDPFIPRIHIALPRKALQEHTVDAVLPPSSGSAAARSSHCATRRGRRGRRPSSSARGRGRARTVSSRRRRATGRCSGARRQGSGRRTSAATRGVRVLLARHRLHM